MTPTSNSPSPRGLFVTFEGGEGTGKTTQSKILADRLGAAWTREPGGTELGVEIRKFCLGDSHNPSALTELLLMAADRSHHVDTYIEPLLTSGTSVVCDRYTHSTVAYQGAGRGLSAPVVEAVTAVAEAGTTPDLVIVIDVADDERQRRLRERGGADRLEQAGDEFHARVAASFRAQAQSDRRMVIVNGEGSVDEVATRVFEAYANYFAPLRV